MLPVFDAISPLDAGGCPSNRKHKVFIGWGLPEDGDAFLFRLRGLRNSAHLNIWQALSKKDKLGVSQKVYCSYTALVRFVFFNESCSNVHMTWNLKRASHIKLSTEQKKRIFFQFFYIFTNSFLTGCRWAWSPKRPTRWVSWYDIVSY